MLVRAKRLPNGEVEMTVPIETGIGIGTNIHPSGLVIEWVPADDGTFRQADLAPGDVITAINSVSIQGMDLAALTKFVRTLPVLEGGVLKIQLTVDSSARQDAKTAGPEKHSIQDALNPSDEDARVE